MPANARNRRGYPAGSVGLVGRAPFGSVGIVDTVDMTTVVYNVYIVYNVYGRFLTIDTIDKLHRYRRCLQFSLRVVSGLVGRATFGRAIVVVRQVTKNLNGRLGWQRVGLTCNNTYRVCYCC
jgi:hypothetical protein